MAQKTPFRRGQNPRSLANLKYGEFAKFSTENELASKAGKKSAEVRRAKRVNEEIVDSFLAELVDMVFSNCTIDEFKKKALDAPNQALRVCALNLANPKTAMSALEWILDRVKGKPKQMVEQDIQASIEAHPKPNIVFEDGE